MQIELQEGERSCWFFHLLWSHNKKMRHLAWQCLDTQGHSGGHSLAAFAGVESFFTGVVSQCRGNLCDEVFILGMPLHAQLFPDTLSHMFVFERKERDEIIDQVLLDQLTVEETTWKREWGALPSECGGGQCAAVCLMDHLAEDRAHQQPWD